MMKRRQLMGGLLAVPLLASPAFAGRPVIFAPGGVAISGIDPVTYFTDARPVQGSHVHGLKWRNAIWHFASSRNRAMFERNPHRFAPRYGGFCAMSMSQGGVSHSLPDAWAIHDGQLYLTHSLDAIARWQRDPATYIARADTHWPNAVCD